MEYVPINSAFGRQHVSPRPVCFHLVGAQPLANIGGSNTFVKAIAQRQIQFGWKPVIVINQLEGESPTQIENSSTIADGEQSSMCVRTLPPVGDASRHAYFSRRPDAALGVKELFAEFKPAVAHFHTLGLTPGLPHLEAAKEVNARTIVTYHTGGISCPQTGLLENGVSPCDGKLEIVRCTRCRFANRGMPIPLAGILARIPTMWEFENADESLLARLLSSRRMTQAFLESFRRIIELVDVFHIQSHWIRGVLLSNGVPEDKIVFVEMGVSQAPTPAAAKPVEKFGERRPLRLVFAGRCFGVKGIETIFAALGYLSKDAPLQVSLLGSGWDTAYGQGLLQQVDGDKRVLPPKAIQGDKMLLELSKYDACLIPSTWLETGPLAVYEAMAAGVPVIGTRLGGIAERIRDNIDGLLFPAGDAKALASIITGLLASPDRLGNLRNNIRPQRTFDDTARELDLIYRSGAFAAHA